MKVFKTQGRIRLDEGIKVNKFSGKKAEPPHMHDFLEFVYIYSGEGVQVVDDVEYKVAKGDMLFINTNQIHSFYTDTDMDYVNFCIQPVFFDEHFSSEENIFDFLSISLFKEFEGSISKKGTFVRFSGNTMMVVDNIIEQILMEFKIKKIGYKSIIKSYISILISMFLRECSKQVNMKNSDYIRTIAPEIIKYIDSHCYEKLSLSELAAKCFYNPAYFCRIFKQCYGESLKRYIQKKRISKAIDLLTLTDKSVSDICSEVGYNDKTQFYRVFKKHTGVAPNEYRMAFHKKVN